MKLIATIFTTLISLSVYAQDLSFTAQPLVQTIHADDKIDVKNWTPGDEANYKINIGGFINGTMHSFVREEVTEGFWIQQDMDMGFMGKQKVEMLIDHSGRPLQLLVNGNKQEIPNADDQELIEMEESEITVPAGHFRAIYVKVKNKKDNNISEAWINPEEIPVMGLLKQLGNSQMGQVVVELTGYDKK